MTDHPMTPIEALHAVADGVRHEQNDTCRLIIAASDTIRAQEAEIAKLREALQAARDVCLRVSCSYSMNGWEAIDALTKIAALKGTTHD